MAKLQRYRNLAIDTNGGDGGDLGNSLINRIK